ncbi:hypothetical protein OL67_003944 (plasmid) [Phaeobacter piscinae]|nr:hypothetical protein OL67_003944 [Phaeobacter piscinae]
MDKIIAFLKTRDPIDLLFLAVTALGAVFFTGWPGWASLSLLCIELLRQIRRDSR